jgi:hypothetical protein
MRAGARTGGQHHRDVDRVSPATITVNQNDTIVWTNTDTADHQLVSDRKAGVSSPVLHTGQTYSFTFANDGRFTIKDAMNQSLRATVVVQKVPAPAKPAPVPRAKPAAKTPAAAKAAATSLTIAPASLAVVYGGTTALSGTVAGNQAGVKVDIMAEPWGEKTFHKLATVTTGAGGKWSYAAKPSIRTAYRATVGNASSADVVVGVHPLVAFHALGGNRFSTRVTAAHSFAGRRVQLQRRSAFGQWVTMKRIQLNRNSAASFKAKLPNGNSRLRVAMSVNQAGAGYLGGSSGTITFHAT